MEQIHEEGQRVNRCLRVRKAGLAATAVMATSGMQRLEQWQMKTGGDIFSLCLREKGAQSKRGVTAPGL